MARIRTIKPEFWSDEKLAPLDPLTRLVFLGLISQADDAGRLIDSIRQLDGLIFPFTEDTCAESLETLARLSRIVRYTSESGQALIQITGWDDHQRVDKPSKHLLPPPPPQVLARAKDNQHSRDPREEVARPSRDPRAPTLDRGPGTMDHGSTTNPPSPREDVENSDPLTEWLGEHAELVADCPLIRDQGARKSLHAQFGPPEMRANAWKRPDGTSVPPDDRPRILAAALLGYAGEGNHRIIVSEFAGMLRRTIRDEATEPAGTGSGTDLSHWKD